jgi:hypothetical protein
VTAAAPDPMQPAKRSWARRTVLLVGLLGTVVAVAVAALLAVLLRPSGPSTTAPAAVPAVAGTVGTAIRAVPNTASSPMATPPSERSTVIKAGDTDLVYEVIGSGVTVIAAPEGQRLDRPSLPWRAVVPMQNRNAESVQLVAQTGPAGGSVTCRVTHRGMVVVEDTKSGVNVQAICSGVVQR